MSYDIVIAGAGIVGLATGYQLLQQQPGLKLAILDKEDGVACHQTGHNSGVIHSGIYYKPGSLKATNCIKGYNLLLGFCREHEIAFDLCGKVIIASDEAEHERLLDIQKRGEENGLTGIELLDEKGLKEQEPHAAGYSALLVPQTGIIDYKQVSRVLAAQIETLGGTILTCHQVLGLKQTGATMQVSTSQGNIETHLFVNCAGLYSDKVAALEGLDTGLKIIPFRGEYFELRQEATDLVRNLIYPVPDPAFPFLGVHFTRMIYGGVEAGPNAVLATAREGYKKTDINPTELAETLAWPGMHVVAAKYWQTGLGEMYRSFSKPAFTRALQKLVPAIREKHLRAAGAGVRAQACDRQGNLLDDFCIEETTHSVHVLNAPSPAATSSLAIGQTVAEMVLRKG